MGFTPLLSLVLREGRSCSIPFFFSLWWNTSAKATWWRKSSFWLTVKGDSLSLQRNKGNRSLKQLATLVTWPPWSGSREWWIHAASYPLSPLTLHRSVLGNGATHTGQAFSPQWIQSRLCMQFKGLLWVFFFFFYLILLRIKINHDRLLFIPA